MLSCCTAPSRPALPAVPDTLACFQGRELNGDLALYLDTYQSSLKDIMQSLPKAGQPFDPASPWEESHGAPDGVTVHWANIANVKGPVVVSECKLQADADVMFSLMTSKEGFAIIDPDTGHKEPLEVLQWRDRAEMTYGVAKVPAPMCWERSYLVLNAMDHVQRLYVSVPVMHKRVPLEQDHKDKRIRASNVWATWIEPTEDGCIMRSLCWIDFGGSIPPSQVYAALKREFFRDFHTRLNAHIKQKPELYKKLADKVEHAADTTDPSDVLIATPQVAAA